MNFQRSEQDPQLSTLDSLSRGRGAQRSVELHIEDLVLHGFAPGQRYVIGDTVERELARLLGERGIPSSLRSENATEEIRGTTFNVAHGTKPPAIGRQIAQAVYQGFGQ